ncbi:choice-of-anchor K domain-containing protein [Dichelobacter nodosus]|uniref:choice-of-anchor K domain-containing protein n=1 Tax=Dichelobacter nodosus TaxID=870 RepID=UPI00197ACF78|nr:choice-of-anchor K domain-containing protein [Dichelobacter nodosus]
MKLKIDHSDELTDRAGSDTGYIYDGNKDPSKPYEPGKPDNPNDADQAPPNKDPIAVDDKNSGKGGDLIEGNLIKDKDEYNRADYDPDGSQEDLKVVEIKVDTDGDGTLDTVTIGKVTPITDKDGKPIGTLIVHEDGTYNFTSDKDFVGKAPVIRYVIVDGEGAKSNEAILTLEITDKPATITIETLARVTEEGLKNGNKDSDGSPDDVSSKLNGKEPIESQGVINIRDEDDDLTGSTVQLKNLAKFTSNGKEIEWTQDGAKHTAKIGDKEILIVELKNGGNVQNVTKNGSGSDAKIGYTVTLKNPVDHPKAGVEDVLNLLGDVIVSNKDGKLGNANITLVQIDDDSPKATAIEHKIQVQKDTFILSELKAGFDTNNTHWDKGAPYGDFTSGNIDGDALHEKLSWTGQDGNNKIASYEADEEKEFNDAGKDITKDFGNLFKIGYFIHENNQISGGKNLFDTSLQLNFTLEINGVKQSIGTHYNMVHAETSNKGDNHYDSNDLVMIPNTHQLISVGGQQYWLDITFVQKGNSRGNVVSEANGYSKEYVEAYNRELALRAKNSGKEEHDWSEADQLAFLEIQKVYSNDNRDALIKHQRENDIDDDKDGLTDTTAIGIDIGHIQDVTATIQTIFGRSQSVAVKYHDLNKDGKFDAIDTNNDGIIDYYDTDHDGILDAQDADHDGSIDRQYDKNVITLPKELVGVNNYYAELNSNGNIYLRNQDQNYEFDSKGNYIIAEDTGTNGSVYRDVLYAQTNNRVDLYDINKDGFIDAIDTNRDGIIDHKFDDSKILYDYAAALDKEGTQVIDTIENKKNEFDIKARLTPAKPMPKVDNSIVIQDALEVGSDSENVTVEWSQNGDKFVGEKNFSNVNGINYGKFIGKADGSYQFIVSDELSAQIADGKTVAPLKIGFKYTDSDGDSAGQTLTFNFEEHDMKSIGADGVHMKNGEDSNDFLIGSVYADELHGGKGADILVGYGAINGTSSNYDKLYGEEGNDILYFDSNTYIDGGTGEDTLYLNGYSTDLSGHENTKIDFSAISSMIHHIEVIDMVDPTQTIAKNQVKFAQELTISADQVLDLSDTDQLCIKGDNQDIVHLGGFKLTKTEGDYHQYTADNGASVQISVSIDEHNIYLF